ncbi:hypothetical protein C0J52_27321, partial [Blattella germanica]
VNIVECTTEVPPHRNNINRWDKQLKETGSLLDQKRSGRPSVSDESVDAIRDTYLRSPKKSVRACARELQLKKTTVHKGKAFHERVSEENIEHIRNRKHKKINPKKTSLQLVIPHSIVHNIVHKKLLFRAVKIQLIEKIEHRG